MATTTSDSTIALDADSAAIVALLAASGLPAYEDMTVAQARATLAQFGPAMAFPKVDVASVEQIAIPGPGDAPLELRVYRPVEGGGAAPVLVYLHGGGWMLGNLDSHDDICRKFCAAAGIVVVAVDYRLAPEHIFPAAVDDVFAAIRWVVANSARIGADANRIVVGGDSAGGNLAAVAALAAAAGDLPPLVGQMLLYPVTDLAQESAAYTRVVAGVPLTAATMRWFKAAYLASPSDAADWRASPLGARSLRSTAPAFVATMYHDPLCDEGIAYARRLAEAGTVVTYLHYWQHIHGIASMGGLIRDAEGLIASACAWLDARFRPPPTIA